MLRCRQFCIFASIFLSPSFSYSQADRSNIPLAEVTVSMVENPVPVPSVKMGKAEGGLRIKNVPCDRTRIEPESVRGTVSVSHPDCPGGQGLFSNNAQDSYSGRLKNYKEMFEAFKAEIGGFGQGFKEGVAACFDRAL